MNAQFGHIEIKVRPGSLGFYKDFFAFLNWPTLYEEEAMLGVGGKNGDSLWFVASANDAKNDYDGVGMNHLAFSVPSQAEVDEAAGYLTRSGIEAIFETPRHRPEFASSADETYYQVMFASPDKILFEVVYTGPKQ